MKKLYDLVNHSIQPFKKIQADLERPQWNLEAIQVYIAREDFKVAGEGVNIAVIDSGVAMKHSEIKHCIKGGENVANPYQSQNLKDDDHHGTMTIGVIAGKHTGVAPQANIYVVKQTKNSVVTTFDHLSAFLWCLYNAKIDIINVSSGYWEYSSDIAKAVKELHDNGKIIVAACGNYSTGAIFPASFDDYVVSVAAVNEDFEHCTFSNIWPTVDVSAPGHNILSSYSRKWQKDYYATEKGTSLAAPQVTGVLALGISLLKKHKISYTPIELEQMLKDSCMNLGSGIHTQTADDLVEKYQGYYDKRKIFLRDKDATLTSMYGHGLIQAYNFLEFICKEKGMKIEKNI